MGQTAVGHWGRPWCKVHTAVASRMQYYLSIDLSLFFEPSNVTDLSICLRVCRRRLPVSVPVTGGRRRCRWRAPVAGRLPVPVAGAGGQNTKTSTLWGYRLHFGDVASPSLISRLNKTKTIVSELASSSLYLVQKGQATANSLSRGRREPLGFGGGLVNGADLRCSVQRSVLRCTCRTRHPRGSAKRNTE